MDLDRIFEQARDACSARIAVGDPVERGGTTVIPVVRLRGCGCGGCGREREGGGTGGGFGLSAAPVGAWVIRGDEVAWEPAVDATRIALVSLAVLALALLRFRR